MMVMSPDLRKEKKKTKCTTMRQRKINDKELTLYSALKSMLMKNHNKPNKKAGYTAEDCMILLIHIHIIMTKK